MTRMTMSLKAENGATLCWLPAETIIHKGARLMRDFSITLAPDSQLLLGEMLQIGRIASGERFTSGSWQDRWRLRIGGKLVLAEEFHLKGEEPRSGHPGALAGQPFMATLILAMPDAGERLAGIREAFGSEPTVQAGATSHSGLVFARALSSNDVALRRAFLSAVRAAAGGDLQLSRLLMLQ
jgi:urease accessory protein